MAQFQTEMNGFKEAIKNVYSSMNSPIDFCPFVPDKIQGVLNVTKILETFHLNSLVEFHDNTTYNTTINQYNKNLKFSYLNETNDGNNSNNNNNKTVTPYDDLFWHLWNTHNMSLLNTSLNDFDFTNGRAPVQLGGYWRPADCKSRFKLAIIVPFRDRLPHLKVLSRFLHMLLQRQLIDYRIFVVEPAGLPNSTFNKGKFKFIDSGLKYLYLCLNCFRILAVLIE